MADSLIGPKHRAGAVGMVELFNSDATGRPALSRSGAVGINAVRNRLVMGPLCTMYAAPDERQLRSALRGGRRIGPKHRAGAVGMVELFNSDATGRPALSRSGAVGINAVRNRLVMGPLCTMYAAPDERQLRSALRGGRRIPGERTGEAALAEATRVVREQASPAQLCAQPVLRIGPGDAAAEIHAEPGLGVAAVMAHADLDRRRQAGTAAEADRPRPFQAEAQTGHRCPGCGQAAAVRSARRVGRRLHNQRVGLAGQGEAVPATVQQVPAQAGRRHPEVQVRADRGAVLVRPRLLRGHRELARAVTGGAPCVHPLGERKAPPRIEARQRGFHPALAVADVAAIAGAARDDQTGGPVLTGPVDADHGARDLAVEREVTRANIRGLRLFYRRGKTGQEVDLPIVPELARELGYLPPEQMMLLAHGERAKAYSATPLGNWFKGRCKEAGLPHCTTHGLRKAGARRLAEAGATEWEVMAFLAHRTAKEASRYTAAANRSILTTSGMARLSTKPEQILSNHPSKLDKQGS